MHRRTSWSVVVAVLALAACGSESPSGEADGGSSDASVALDAARDAGSTGDAGSTHDAAATSDAGSTDAGAAVGTCTLDLAPYLATDCFCGDACDCYRDVPYGEGATWTEGRNTFTQAIDLYLPRGATGPTPLVFWAHPNGATKNIGASGAIATDVATPLLAEGVAFASIEFRHPAVDAAIGAPRTDIADAIQFMRCNATTLNIDAPRMAAIARSRGTLSVWTAVQDDMADPDSVDPVHRESTRLRAVWAMNAQTSYWGDWIAETFYTEASRELIYAEYGHDDYGHAVGDATADDPPIHFRYDSDLQELPLDASQCMPAGGPIDCVHLPNFGDAFCDAYGAAGIADRCELDVGLTTAQLTRGAVDFLLANL